MTLSRAAGPKRSELGIRTAAGLAMIAVAVAAIVRGGGVFWALVAAATLAMVGEWAGLVKADRTGRLAALAAAAVVLLLALPNLMMDGETVLAALAAGAVAAALAGRAAALGAGLLYCLLPALALLLLRDQPAGVNLTIWTLAIVWATDIGAYFAGRSIGGRKLSPKISPNKTWAGLLGGMVSALVLGWLLVRALHLPPLLAALGGVLAFLAQMGDLFESWLKRRAGVKDSGRILPGHGGVLDRLDGVVPVACVIGLLLLAGLL